MWKDSIRNIVVIFQPNILIIVEFYVRHWAIVLKHFNENPVSVNIGYLTKVFFCYTLPRNHLDNLNEQNLACPIMDGRGNDIRHGSKHKKTHQTSSNNCNQTRKITHPLLNKRKPIVLLDLSQVNIWEFSDMSKFLS